MDQIKKADFKNLREMPQSSEVFNLDWHLNQNQLEKLKNGFAASDMDQKWNIYFDDGKLYLHRSWTGSCIYIADVFEQKDGSGLITTVTVNRNKDEYNFSSAEADKNLIRKIIQFQLLDYEPRVKEIDLSDERLSVIKKEIPAEYVTASFSYYKESIANLRLTWNSYPENKNINMNLTSGIESTIQKLNTTNIEFANVLTTTHENKMLLVITDETFLTPLGVIQFLKIPPLK
jgi:hypothetical protein